MKEASVTLYQCTYRESKTYLFGLLFAVGNIILPQLCHGIPHGGPIFLPIYFFTLVGAYKYGWKVGLITAVLSPVVNSLLFGMPALAVLPVILTKSILLAFSAGLASEYFKKISLWSLLLVVLSYQIVGSLLEWAYWGEFSRAIQDFKMGFPGMIIQVLGGYTVLRYLFRK